MFTVTWDGKSHNYETQHDADVAVAVLKAFGAYGIECGPVAPKIDGILFRPEDLIMFDLCRKHDAKVSCIKYVRCRSGAGLKESKDWCDFWVFNDTNYQRIYQA